MRHTILILVLAVLFAVIIPLVVFGDLNDDLIEAARNGQTNEVRNLLDAGADVNAKHGFLSRTALMVAAYEGKTKVVRILLDAGADVNVKDGNYMTPLHFAIDGGYNTEIVRLLLDADTDVNARSAVIGGTATTLARKKGYIDVVKLLKEAGGREVPRQARAKEPEQEAETVEIPAEVLNAIVGGQPEKVILYLAMGVVDSNARDKGGRTILMLAAREDMVDVVLALLVQGANVNAEDEEGETALTYAKEKDLIEIVEMLKEAGAEE